MRPASGLLLLLGAVMLSGCADSLARRDTITPFAGDSSAQAIVAQAVNPWPKAAYRKRWPSRWTAPAANPAP